MLAFPLRLEVAGAALAACLACLPFALPAQPDFGDNTSRWADDGECDDPRFEGDGMAETLLQADAYHDATDCRSLHEKGLIALRGAGRYDAARPDRHIEHSGRLEPGDDTLTTGELVDRYDFEGLPGQHVSIDLRSTAFDTYLILKHPSGEQTENDDADDAGGDVGHSNVEADLAEAGTYEVLVTTYESGESGAYSLTIDVFAAADRRPAAQRDATALTVGGPVTDEPRAYDILFER